MTAATLLIKETFDIDVNPALKAKYNKSEPEGCYVVASGSETPPFPVFEVRYNVHQLKYDRRLTCSPTMLCICKTCGPGAYRDEELKNLDSCTTCPAGYKNNKYGSVECSECSDPGGGLTKLYST